ncbi:helix-turn-helix domain-containing protein [Patescibacteria group bacterium]|nr:helix-turn-helix domain-containing protein [Patescibacteria group bacterium]
MKNNEFFTTAQLAELLGVSRIAVFKKIKKGEIKAEKIGRNFVIRKKDLGIILGKILTEDQKSEIDKTITRVINEYGETLKKLGET